MGGGAAGEQIQEVMRVERLIRGWGNQGTCPPTPVPTCHGGGGNTARRQAALRQEVQSVGLTQESPCQDLIARSRCKDMCTGMPTAALAVTAGSYPLSGGQVDHFR